MSLSVPRERLTQALLVTIAVGIWGLIFLHALPYCLGEAGRSPQVAKFSEITVDRINIVDPNGTVRLVISNGPRLPPVMTREGKTYPRSISDAAGLTFFEADGTETGGIASSTQPGGARQFAMIFDYTYQLTDGVSIGKRESVDGKTTSAGLFVADRRPFKSGPLESSEGIERIALTNNNQNAALVISGTDGKPRLRLGVDRDNAVRLEILDAEGKATSLIH